jgi:predicted Zn-dependent protease
MEYAKSLIEDSEKILQVYTNKYEDLEKIVLNVTIALEASVRCFAENYGIHLINADAIDTFLLYLNHSDVISNLDRPKIMSGCSCYS